MFVFNFKRNLGVHLAVNIMKIQIVPLNQKWVKLK